MHFCQTSTFSLQVNRCFPTYSFWRLLILWFAKPAVHMVHASPASPLTGLCCLKQHRDLWSFTWCCDSSSSVFLSKGTESHPPCPAAAILHASWTTFSQATFCMLPKHGPDPTVTEYSLGILLAATKRALPQSPAGHRWEQAQSQHGLWLGTAGPAPRAIPNGVWCSPVSILFSRQAGYTPARCKLVCAQEQTWPGAVSGWCMAVHPWIYKQPLCLGQNPPLRESVRTVPVEIPGQACIAALILWHSLSQFWVWTPSIPPHAFPLFHSLPEASTTSLGSNQKFTHRRTGMVSSPVSTLLGWGVKWGFILRGDIWVTVRDGVTYFSILGNYFYSPFLTQEPCPDRCITTILQLS